MSPHARWRPSCAGSLAVATIDALLSEVVVPYLHDIGERWERDKVSIAQEHFASNLLRGRLLASRAGGVAGRAGARCSPVRRVSGTTSA